MKSQVGTWELKEQLSCANSVKGHYATHTLLPIDYFILMRLVHLYEVRRSRDKGVYLNLSHTFDRLNQLGL